jgi:type II secretory pathway pseudopilin PulG
MATHRRSGFTLIELLVFSAIFSVIIGSFITILIVVVDIQSRQSASNEVAQQGQFLVQQLQYDIGSARLVDAAQDVATSTLVLREPIASLQYDPTTFTLSSSTVYLRQGVAGALQPITSNRVKVSNLLFTRHYNLNGSSSPAGTDSVSFSFVMSANSGNQSQYSQTFRSSAPVLTPVSKIALIQQTKVENNTPSASSIAKAFPTANEAGDLLLAVVAYQGTGTSSVSDTDGNTWVRVASGTITSPSGTVALYAALNAAGGANTTTASFAPGATYTSLFLYEYRGASTSTSLDTWGAQAQAGTSTPSSPSVNPAANVELLFGIDDNAAPTTAIFSPTGAYTLETSSTAGNTTQVFVEDQSQYITGAVSAPWTSSVLTSSTALIATFK